MSELDELVASPGVFMAGRFGADERAAEHKTAGPVHRNAALTGIAQWFCAAVTTMFGAMAYAAGTATQSGFGQSRWLPVRSRTYSGGDYVIAVHGGRFLTAECAKLASLGELSQLLRAGQP